MCVCVCVCARARARGGVCVEITWSPRPGVGGRFKPFLTFAISVRGVFGSLFDDLFLRRGHMSPTLRSCRGFCTPASARFSPFPVPTIKGSGRRDTRPGPTPRDLCCMPGRLGLSPSPLVKLPFL